MELFEQIRKDRRVEGASIREPADRHHMHRRALAQAHASDAFTASHQRYWDATRRALGDAAGTRALIEVLLGHRTLPAASLCEAMDRAMHSGVLDCQAVLIDARRLATGPVAPVIPIGVLARYDPPAPGLAGYDQLLSGTAQ